MRLLRHLAPQRRLVLAAVSCSLLNNLIPQSTPSEQIELIQVVEQLALLQPETTLQVSNL